MIFAISGTTSGLGKALKEILETTNTVISINREDFENLNNLSLANVDVLINNAGHALGGGINFQTHSPDQWQSIIDHNMSAPIFLTQKFLNQNSKGTVIFITSISVEKAMGGDSVYTAAKSGLSAFIDCLREELKSTNFNLVEIRPGRMKTNFRKNRKIHQEEKQDFYPDGGYMLPEEVAKVVIFAAENRCIDKITLIKKQL